jgi:hypothetical protein
VEDTVDLFIDEDRRGEERQKSRYVEEERVTGCHRELRL